MVHIHDSPVSGKEIELRNNTYMCNLMRQNICEAFLSWKCLFSEKRKPASQTCSSRLPLTEREERVLIAPLGAVLGSSTPERTPKILF